MSETFHYTMPHPTASTMLNKMYQRACNKGFGLPGTDKYFLIGSQETLDIINEVNTAIRALKADKDALIAELELIESRHIQAALASKSIKQKSAHYEAASDARRALGKGDV